MISITVNHALIGVFVLGLAVGLSAGMMLGGGQTLVGDVPEDNSDAPAPSGTNNNGGNSAGDIGYVDNSKVSGSSTTEVMASIADNLGMDGDQLASCVEAADESEITTDKNRIAGNLDRIGTPTFLIGTSEIGYERVRGAQPYSRMKGTIDEQVSEAQNPGSDSVEDDEHLLTNIELEGEPTLGQESAPINIIEYSDYGCPWCAEWHGVDAIPQRPIDQEKSFDKVRSNYVETGKVRFVSKDFPVPRLHPQAMTAHKAANCVWEQDQEKFWKFSAEIYDNRDQW